MKQKNTGAKLEKEVYELISEIVNKNQFMVSNPNVRIREKPRYYSKDRNAEIEFDVSVEKYLADPDKSTEIKPSIVIVIECKDYSNGIPVDDVEEFHAKLQQIGADNTKGVIITKNGCFQKSAIRYAESKGIALARIVPLEQIEYVTFFMMGFTKITEQERKKRLISPLVEKDYVSLNQSFYSLTGDNSLEELIIRLFIS